MIQLFLSQAFAQTIPVQVLPAAPETLDQAVGMLPALAQAFQTHNYSYFAAVLLMIVLFGVKKYWLKEDSQIEKNMPVVSTGIGTILGGAFAAFTHMDIISGLLGGSMVGNAASGLYDLIFKRKKSK